MPGYTRVLFLRRRLTRRSKLSGKHDVPDKPLKVMREMAAFGVQILSAPEFLALLEARRNQGVGSE
jgi:hypothetical protein